MELYTNSDYRKDFFKNALEKYGKNTQVFIASAFFSNSSLIKELLKNNCRIQLIIQLGTGTNIKKLKEIINEENLEIRFFTSPNFHPKFYIFENKIAFLGSSNLTSNGATSNREANVSIDPESNVYEDLLYDFDKYWESAKVLNLQIINDYQSLFNKNDQLFLELYNFEKEIVKKFGNDTDQISSVLTNRTHEKDLKRPYLESYKKNYNNFLKEFKELEGTYIQLQKRKITENLLPLRIEIDQFFNWIRENKCKGDSYLNVTPKSGKELKQFSIENIEEYIQSKNEYFEYIVNTSYPFISKSFKSKETIDELNEAELKEALEKIHSFSSRKRFFNHGYDHLFEAFLEKNGIDKIKNSLNFILHESENYIERLASYQFESEYRLNEFGENCSKELFGWINEENIPIYNRTTFIAMKWLGYNL